MSAVGLIFVQSDVQIIGQDMCDQLLGHPSAAFSLHPLHSQPDWTGLQGAQQEGGQGGELQAPGHGLQGLGDEEAVSGQGGQGPQSKVSQTGGGQARSSAEVVEEQGQGHEKEEHAHQRSIPWLQQNPVGMPTERDLYVARGGRGVWRALLVRQE